MRMNQVFLVEYEFAIFFPFNELSRMVDRTVKFLVGRV